MTIQEPTVIDPRVLDIAAVTGETPEEILADARQDAAASSSTTSAVLDEGEAAVEMVKELSGALDGMGL